MQSRFIGTGTIGQPMRANLLRKRFEVVVLDVVPAALEAAIASGAARADAECQRLHPAWRARCDWPHKSAVQSGDQ
jgi:3-hydroxyisobutyrate dehydrogenase-like beta-hydroxyacid dehydrogenase